MPSLNPLIPLHQTSLPQGDVQTVNARELHAFLESGDKFADWIKKRITKYNFVENQDFTIVSANAEAKRGGQNRKDYYLTLDMAKELSMVERNDRGKQARLYFIECERRARLAAGPRSAQAALDDPATVRGLLLAYAEKVIDIEARVKDMAPKVEFHDAVADSTDCQSIPEVAKVFGIGSQTLYALMRADKILMPNNLPYQRHIDAGHLKVREAVDRKEASAPRLSSRTLITGAGLIYLQKRLRMWRGPNGMSASSENKGGAV